MYKLVIVAGKLRGKEFLLKEGDNILGRSSDCDLHLEVEGVSKRHLSLTVTGDSLFVKDLNSSNGTFLNGELVKTATVVDGDKIALPDIIGQVVYVKEKKIIVKKQVVDEATAEDYLKGGEAPNNIFGKVLYSFKYKIMPILHGINEEYEWRSLFAILLTIFIVLAITLTIFPVLESSRGILKKEIELRAKHYVEEIERLNFSALSQKQLGNLDTSFLDKEDGIKSYVLFDLEDRIFRPLNRMNEYISDPFSVKVKEWATNENNNNDEEIYNVDLAEGEIGIGKKIMAFDHDKAKLVTVGIIAIKFAPRSLAVEATKRSTVYFESLIATGIVAIIFFGVVYFLTLRPLEEMKYQIEDALRGKRRALESKYRMVELKGLRDSINSLLQRIRELSRNDDDESFDEVEGDESYVARLVELMKGAGVPVMILNSEKNVSKISIDAEDITGIRESVAEGMSLLDVSREKGFAATVIELCDLSANSDGSCQQGEYELQGRPYQIFVTSLMGRDNFAKAFYVTFIEGE